MMSNPAKKNTPTIGIKNITRDINSNVTNNEKTNPINLGRILIDKYSIINTFKNEITIPIFFLYSYILNQ